MIITLILIHNKMKKFLFVMLMAFIAIGLMSCESCANKAEGSNDTNDLIYNVTATAEGQVEFNWFNGGAKVDGYAEVHQCNDTTVVLKNAVNDSTMLLSEALKSNDVELVKVAEEVNSMLTVNGIDGKYHLKVVGYVKYGPIILRIDEEYPKVVDETVDE
jgi:hypothetical protein